MNTSSDPYARIVSLIRDDGESVVSVPRLSNLLGVKATTLNARFRRLRIAVRTVGRVNFVPQELALELAGLHKYALLGWPTLQQASQLTAVKSCTIKAKCEKGQVEGYMDLTKRLRINPAALDGLRSARPRSQRREQCAELFDTNPRSLSKNGVSLAPGIETKSVRRSPRGLEVRERKKVIPSIPPPGRPPELPPARGLEIALVTARDYGLPEPILKTAGSSPKALGSSHKPSGDLCYDPDRPFSLSDCAVGKPIKYGEYSGTIVGILDEPFNPKIKVRFPEHRHPLMQEVLLVVEKRRS